MILDYNVSIQLSTWRSETTPLHELSWQRILQRVQQYHRRIHKYFRSQYYPTTALTDTRNAIRLNEDIALGALIVQAILSFAGMSILSTLVFYFVMVASMLSVDTGINITALITLALGVIAVLGIWLGAFMQNMWTYALYEGVTRKQYKSLRRTMRNSLHNAAQTAIAWCMLLLAAIAPGALLSMLVLGLLKLLNLPFSSIIIYGSMIGALALVWAIWVLLNFSLLPQVALLGAHTSWKDAAIYSQKLVSRKGRMFTLGSYAACGLGLCVSFLTALIIHLVTGTETMLSCILLALIPFTILNSCMTMLFRKRRLSRS